MPSPVRLCLLRVLPAVIVILATIKAAGYVRDRVDTPRRLAERFLAGPGLDSGTGSPPTGTIFTDVAPQMGVRFGHDNDARGTFRLPEQMGPGAGFIDIDGDGDLDVFIAGGGPIARSDPPHLRQTCRLYRNDGDRFTDITEASGAGVPGPAYGVACADFDNDGDVDILVTRLGPDALLRNDGPPEAPRFTDVAREAGVADPRFGASATFFDYDRDG